MTPDDLDAIRARVEGLDAIVKAEDVRERRIRSAVKALPHEHSTDNCVDRAAVLRIIEAS